MATEPGIAPVTDGGGDDARRSLDVNASVSPTKLQSIEDCAWRYRESRLRGAAGGNDSSDAGKAAHRWIERYGAHCERNGIGRDVAAAEAMIAEERLSWNIEWRDDCAVWCSVFASEYEWPFAGESYVPGSAVFERRAGFNVAGAEVDYFGDDVFCRLTIDFGYMVADAAGDRYAVAPDWKTSKSQLAEGRGAEVETYKVKQGRDGYIIAKGAPKDRQLRWYIKALLHQFPDADYYVLGHYYLRSGHYCFTPPISRADAEHILEMLWVEMAHDSAKLARMIEADEWPATECEWCGYCQFGPERGDDTCPKWRTAADMMDLLVRGVPLGAAPAESKPAPATATTTTTTESMMADTPTLSFGRSSEHLPPIAPAKILLVGDAGTLKTRNILHAFGDPIGTPEPRLFYMDEEFGAEDYKNEWEWVPPLVRAPDGSMVVVRDNIKLSLEFLEMVRTGKLPPHVVAAAIDSWSLFCTRWENWWNDILKARKGGTGDKVEFYETQPQDYKVLKAKRADVVESLINSPYHLVLTAHIRPKYAKGEMMKVIGDTLEGFEVTKYYCKTVIFLHKNEKTGAISAYTDKDRSRRFPPGIWPWWETALAYYMSNCDPRFAPPAGPQHAAQPAPATVPPIGIIPAPGPAPAAPVEPAEPVGPVDSTAPGSSTPDQHKMVTATAKEMGLNADGLRDRIAKFATEIDGATPPVKLAHMSGAACDAMIADMRAQKDAIAAIPAPSPEPTPTPRPSATVAADPAPEDILTPADPANIPPQPPMHVGTDGNGRVVGGVDSHPAHADNVIGATTAATPPPLDNPAGPITEAQKAQILALKTAARISQPDYIKQLREVKRTATRATELNQEEADLLIESLKVPY